MTKAFEWWEKLSPLAQAALLKDPRAPLTGDLVAEITHAGGSAYSAYWPDTQRGPEEFFLADDLAAYVEGLTSGTSQG